MKLSKAQRKYLGQAVGAYPRSFHYYGPKGFGRGVWDRCCLSLVRLGLLTRNPYGEYEVTQAGRELHEELVHGER